MAASVDWEKEAAELRAENEKLRVRIHHLTKEKEKALKHMELMRENRELQQQLNILLSERMKHRASHSSTTSSVPQRKESVAESIDTITAGSEHGSAAGTELGNPCKHQQAWRRLRLKRGLIHYRCQECTAKFKIPAKSSDKEDDDTKPPTSARSRAAGEGLETLRLDIPKGVHVSAARSSSTSPTPTPVDGVHWNTVGSPSEVTNQLFTVASLRSPSMMSLGSSVGEDLKPGGKHATASSGSDIDNTETDTSIGWDSATAASSDRPAFFWQTQSASGSNLTGLVRGSSNGGNSNSAHASRHAARRQSMQSVQSNTSAQQHRKPSTAFSAQEQLQAGWQLNDEFDELGRRIDIGGVLVYTVEEDGTVSFLLGRPQPKELKNAHSNSQPPFTCFRGYFDYKVDNNIEETATRKLKQQTRNIAGLTLQNEAYCDFPYLVWREAGNIVEVMRLYGIEIDPKDKTQYIQKFQDHRAITTRAENSKRGKPLPASAFDSAGNLKSSWDEVSGLTWWSQAEIIERLPLDGLAQQPIGACKGATHPLLHFSELRVFVSLFLPFLKDNQVYWRSEGNNLEPRLQYSLNRELNLQWRNLCSEWAMYFKNTAQATRESPVTATTQPVMQQGTINNDSPTLAQSVATGSGKLLTGEGPAKGVPIAPFAGTPPTSNSPLLSQDQMLSYSSFFSNDAWTKFLPALVVSQKAPPSPTMSSGEKVKAAHPSVAAAAQQF